MTKATGVMIIEGVTKRLFIGQSQQKAVRSLEIILP